MTEQRPIISLTTDFGLSDAFVGVMKGVIAGICPSANVVDICHAVEAFNILDGALTIWQAWRYFPPETVHVIVVDPGVGSERRAILARMQDHWFIAPDNGVLTLIERAILRVGEPVEYRAIENANYMLPARSNTFHGRDIFAPAAAHLAAQIERGEVAAESFGPILDEPVRLDVAEPVRRPDGSIDGIILKADRFGNLLTNLPAEGLPANGLATAGSWILEAGSLRIERFCRFYGEAEPGEIFVIAGSSGLLEIAMNRGSASERTGITLGTAFRMTPRQV